MVLNVLQNGVSWNSRSIKVHQVQLYSDISSLNIERLALGLLSLIVERIDCIAPGKSAPASPDSTLTVMLLCYISEGVCL